MDYEVRFVISYNVEAGNETEAMLIAEEFFNFDTHLEYDIEVEPIKNN